MIEFLAIPAWNAPDCQIEDWIGAFTSLGHPAHVVRDEDETWLEIPDLQLRGFVEFDSSRPEAVNFETQEGHADQALTALHAVATALKWEIYADTEDQDEEDLNFKEGREGQ